MQLICKKLRMYAFFSKFKFFLQALNIDLYVGVQLNYLMHKTHYLTKV